MTAAIDACTATAQPAPRPRPSSPHWSASAVLIVIAWAALELWGLGKPPFHTKGEPREGLVVWEMTHGGGWILPRRNGVELPSKPPLFHWLGAATASLHGVADEWSIRFPSAALSLIALLCVFAAGGALWGPRAGLISALVLMTMFEWARAATAARVDMTLTFGLQLVFLALLFFLRTGAARWLVALYAGIALAVLGKGPVGAALPGLIALAVLAAQRDFTPLRCMRLGLGALGVTAVAGSWYVLALVFGGTAFFRKQVLAENLFTFLNSRQFGGGHRHSVWYLGGSLLLGLLPWTLFVPATAATLWRQRRQVERHDARLYLLIWIVVVFAFYAVAASKRSVYLLSLYPAMALLLGWWWNERMDAPTEDGWMARFLAAVAWPVIIVSLSVAICVAVEHLGVALVALMAGRVSARARADVLQVGDVLHAAPWQLVAALLASAGLLYIATRAARRARWGTVFAALFAATAAVLLITREVVLPRIAEQHTARDFIRAVRATVGPADTVFFYRTFDYGAVYYRDGHIPTFSGALVDDAPRYLLMRAAQWEQEQATLVHRYAVVPLPYMQLTPPQRRLLLVRRIEADRGASAAMESREPEMKNREPAKRGPRTIFPVPNFPFPGFPFSILKSPSGS